MSNRSMNSATWSRNSLRDRTGNSIWPYRENILGEQGIFIAGLQGEFLLRRSDGGRHPRKPASAGSRYRRSRGQTPSTDSLDVTSRLLRSPPRKQTLIPGSCTSVLGPQTSVATRWISPILARDGEEEIRNDPCSKSVILKSRHSMASAASSAGRKGFKPASRNAVLMRLSSSRVTSSTLPRAASVVQWRRGPDLLRNRCHSVCDITTIVRTSPCGFLQFRPEISAINQA